MKSTHISPGVVARHDAERVLGQPIERDYTLAELLRRPGVTYAALHTLDGAGVPADNAGVGDQVEVSIKYQGYIDRMQIEIERELAHESMPLPADLDYEHVRGLSIEVRQILSAHRPETLGQAARMSGVTPAAISLLLVHLKRRLATGRGTAIADTARSA